MEHFLSRCIRNEIKCYNRVVLNSVKMFITHSAVSNFFFHFVEDDNSFTETYKLLLASLNRTT